MALVDTVALDVLESKFPSDREVIEGARESVAACDCEDI